jgi:glycosyltransferase involved in cell wall biosynthesis
VIAARNSSIPEAGGDSALYFETGDVEGMARWMEEILLDGELRERCVRGGLAHARRFSWERTAEQTASVYENDGRAWPMPLSPLRGKFGEPPPSL